MNEEGSRTAGATVVEMKEAAADPIIFIGDRPFYLSYDDET